MEACFSEMNIKVVLKGPIFEPGASVEMMRAVDGALNEIALHGQSLVQRQLYPGHGVRTGHLRRSIWGGSTGPLKAQIDAGARQQGRNVHYAKYVEYGTRRRVGYFMFHTAARQLSQAAPLEKLRDAAVRSLTS